VKAFALVALALLLSSFASAQAGAALNAAASAVVVVAGDCSTDTTKCRQAVSSYLPAGDGHDKAVVLAMKALGRVRYDFGANSGEFEPLAGDGSADCSSFVQGIVKESFGARVPRTAEEQYAATVPVRLGNQQAGDLIFFKNTYKPGISHVGIVVDNCRFIQASRPTVKWGNYCTGYYRNHFAAIHRVQYGV